MMQVNDTKYAEDLKVYIIARPPYDSDLKSIDYILELNIFIPPKFKYNNEPPNFVGTFGGLNPDNSVDMPF